MKLNKTVKWIIAIVAVIGLIYVLSQAKPKTSESINWSWKPLDTGSSITEGSQY